MDRIKLFKNLIIIFFIASSLSLFAEGKAKTIEVGIDEKLGNTVPMDAVITDSEGNKKKLSDIIDKPVILNLVYYHCPGVCSPLLTGLADVISKVDLEPGKDFEVLTLSFDHNETPAKAREWKNNYLAELKRKIDPKDWTFAVADSQTVRRITNSVGFYFKPDKEDFIHAGSLIILTPDGKASRYLLGTDFLPFDLKMALLEAHDGKFTPTINKMMAYCYSYDRSGKKYVFNATKVAATATLFGLALFVVIFLVKPKKNKANKI